MAVVWIPTPTGLVRMSRSPGRAPPFRQMRSGWTWPVTARPNLKLRIVDGVTADGDGSGLLHLVGGAAQDVDEQGRIQLVYGESHQVEHRQRFRPHGVDVAQTVGGGNLTEGVGIIHHGREKVHRLHQSAFVAEADHSRVVRFRQADEDVVAFFLFTGQAAEYVRKVLGTQFAPSPRFGGQLGQANRFAVHGATSSPSGGILPSIISDPFPVDETGRARMRRRDPCYNGIQGEIDCTWPEGASGREKGVRETHGHH